ncbi:MAG: hypothetical protein H6718_03685 [Polyangiaceae bacterium]|nr:hypothetical protein [Myxococcales bacterium]MCB9584468.1 hypothetical protein [Polyangiaceae bacterium]MCB9609311.1 hypothetical protein [Polyangiaceae bacterium]
MRTIVASVCVLGAALLACKSESSGSITVNGAAFDIAECRSGEANSPPFSGVMFFDSGGNQVRFVGKPEGGFRLFHFTKGQSIGTLVGEDCGSLTVNKTNTKINDIANIEGTVSANCTGGGQAVVANVNYAKCH